jgi:hypothetical protein
MGREWTERHIRELIKNEIIRIEGQGGSGEHPPMDYDVYWPGPIDLVTGGKKAITSIGMTSPWPLAWIEFNGYKQLEDLTTVKAFTFYWRQNATHDGDFIMTLILPGVPEVGTLTWGDGTDLYPVWSEHFHLWRWRQGDYAAAGPVASIYTERLADMINSSPDTILQAKTLDSSDYRPRVYIGSREATSIDFTSGSYVNLYSVGDVSSGKHSMEMYYV